MSKGVLITAGARRLGAEMARWFASQNYRVHIHYFQSKTEATELSQLLIQNGATVFLHQADLHDEAAASQLMDACFSEGPLMTLVNNASAFIYDTAETFDGKTFDEHMTIHAKVPALLMKSFYEHANDPSQDYSVINMTDAKLSNLNSDYYTYTVSKFALDGLTKQAAQAYAPIRVNAIAPHVVLPNESKKGLNFEQYSRLNLLERAVTVSDLLYAVEFLSKAKSVTGTTVLLDGGASLMKQRDPAFS